MLLWTLGNCALGSYCFAVIQANHYSKLHIAYYAQNDQFIGIRDAHMKTDVCSKPTKLSFQDLFKSSRITRRTEKALG